MDVNPVVGVGRVEHHEHNHGRRHNEDTAHTHGHGHRHRDEHAHAHSHGHGRTARRDGGPPARTGGIPRSWATPGSPFIDDEMRSLLDTRVDASRTRLYRARFGADSMLRPDTGPLQPATAGEAGASNAAGSGSSSGGPGVDVDVRDLLDSLSNSIAAECDASTATQRRFYDVAAPQTGAGRWRLGPGSGMPEQPSSAQWNRGQDGAGLSRGLPGGW